MFGRIIRWLHSLSRKDQLEAEMAEELGFHLERQIDDNIKAGMSPQEARRAALLSFGGVEQVKEGCRQTRGFVLVEEIWQDLRYGLRMLRKNPGFTFVAVITLALGIGANTAIFSLINAILIRSLPVPHPDQLVALKVSHRAEARYISYPMYRDLAKHQRVFSRLLATSGQGRKWITLAGSGRQLEQVRTARVSMNYFAVLGVEAQLGRTFSGLSEESSAPEAVISHGFWERQFGRDPGAIGQGLRMTIGNAPEAVERVFTIVGIAPPEFFGETVGDAPEVWIPIVYGIMPSTLKTRRGSFIEVMGRLKQDISPSQALAATSVLFQQLLAEEVASGPTVVLPHHRASDYRITFESAAVGLDRLRRRYSKPLQLLMAGSGVVLFIACTNLANLLLARGASRSREMAVRLALGARRSRVMRQLLTESFILALSGGLVGIGFAAFGSRLLVAYVAGSPGSVLLDVAPDGRVLAFALSLSTLTALAFGLIPALRTASVDVGRALKAAARNQTTGPGAQRLGKTLVVAQMALSLALIGGATLLLSSLHKLYSLDAGFDKTNVLLVNVEIHSVPRPQRPAVSRQIEQGLKDITGARSASLSLVGLFNPGQLATTWVSIEGYEPPPGPRPVVRYNVVSPGYFATVRMRLAAGRDFTDRDTAGAPPVAIVNESFAREFFAGQNPLGQRFLNKDRFDSSSAFEIVGVVRDSKYNDLRQEAKSMFYLPIFQTGSDFGFNSIEVRAHGNPLALAEPVRRVIERAHPAIEIGEFKTLEEQLDRSLTRERLLSKLTTFFGSLALILACIGLYGLLSFGVARRTQEIGIRIALGAERAQVRWLFLREALLLAGIGLLFGMPLALVSGKLVESFLYGLTPADPATLAACALLLLAVALVAAYLPARRASKVDAMTALRCE